MSDQMSHYTEEEAKAIVKRQEKAAPDWFCPFIKDTCHADCYCLVRVKMTHVRELKGTSYVEFWRVHPDYCLLLLNLMGEG